MMRLVVARIMIVPNYYVQRQRARRLRKSMTDAEVKLWQRLRGQQLRHYRQRPLGPFIADFWAPAMGLVIEVDGSGHLDEAGRRYDARRDAWFRRHGIRVTRYDNLQVLTETEAVLEHLLAVIDSLRSHPQSEELASLASPPGPPSKEGGNDLCIHVPLLRFSTT